jgi:hypothetical protein
MYNIKARIALEAYRWSKNVDLRMLNFDARWGSMPFFYRFTRSKDTIPTVYEA